MNPIKHTSLCTNDTPISAATQFKIAAHYRELLASDQDVTAPIAAIESLITLLSVSASSTAAETLDLLERATAELKASVAYKTDAIALSAGTDLFQRYIITALQNSKIGEGVASATEDGAVGKRDDFADIKAHLVANSKTFVQRAKEARVHIARTARGLIEDGSTVLVLAADLSRVVSCALIEASRTSYVRPFGGNGGRGPLAQGFKVIAVLDDTETESESKGRKLVQVLRANGTAVATVPFSALSLAMEAASICMLGAECVLGNGGVVSCTGASQLGFLANGLRKPVYIMVESHKFVRVLPLGSEDLGLGPDDVLNFQSESSTASGIEKPDKPIRRDYVLPSHISGFVTESGIQMPSAVTEELIKIWY